MKLLIKYVLPDPAISHFVHSFWMLENKTGKDIPSTILPNAMVDLTMRKKNSTTWEMFVRGLDTEPSSVVIAKGEKIFTISLKLLAVEYLLDGSVKDVLNLGREVTDEFWKFGEQDLRSLNRFRNKATQKIKTLSPKDIDNRKKKLFDIIYSSNGAMPVKELSKEVYWSSRQINRYFNQQFGISLKTYCNILRFSASFKHISEGKLFPEQNFTDQNHFIKETRKYSGVTPKELSKNKNDRFIDITATKTFPSKNG